MEQLTIGINDRSEQFTEQRGLLRVNQVCPGEYMGKNGKPFRCCELHGWITAIDPVYKKKVEFKVKVNSDNHHGLFFLNPDTEDSSRYTMPEAGALKKLLLRLGLKNTNQLVTLELPVIYTKKPGKDTMFWNIDSLLLMESV